LIGGNPNTITFECRFTFRRYPGTCQFCGREIDPGTVKIGRIRKGNQLSHDWAGITCFFENFDKMKPNVKIAATNQLEISLPKTIQNLLMFLKFGFGEIPNNGIICYIFCHALSYPTGQSNCKLPPVCFRQNITERMTSSAKHYSSDSFKKYYSFSITFK
jgi:hypothetical protein